ncbi:hypothetical protein QL285_015152 [Trifolium repens]|nr:hypothetical protein QL285_015152 [Trifolium repens]
MPQTTCAEIQKNSIVVEFDDKSVDFSYNKPVSIADKLLVELLITPCNMPLSFTICVSLPPILSDSQANFGFCDFHAFVIAGLPYVLAIPPVPPDSPLIFMFTCHLPFPISCVPRLERPQPKPPDMAAIITP